MYHVIDKIRKYYVASQTATVWREILVGRNIGEFGKSSMIRQTETIQMSTDN